MKFRHFLYTCMLAALLMSSWAASAASGARVKFTVDAASKEGPMKPIWAYVGYDEPNYTYMKDGVKLLTELSELSYTPVFVRAHNLLTSGDGTPALKWGSTNAYTEDENGNPVYDWTIVDRIFDTYVERGMKPLVEIGFMPEALSTQPEPYQHNWAPVGRSNLFTGWTFPPTDYDKWRDLVYNWVRHSVERYGEEEVLTWYWEVWNEPDIGYWSGTHEEFCKLYDYAADGLKKALPKAMIGGPETTDPGGKKANEYLRKFLDHCSSGTNYATGKKGAPLDFITFHAKGSPRVVDGHVRMNIGVQVNNISEGFAAVASYPQYKKLPIIIGESDPEGCAACSVRYNPQNAYRNGTMYSSYTAATYARTYELAKMYDVNIQGAVSWAFEYEDQEWFAGFRDMATNGIDKPVLNTLRMFGQMKGDFLTVNASRKISVEDIIANSVRVDEDINALASASDNSIAVMVWNYHDDDEIVEPADIEVLVNSIGTDRVYVQHYRIDENHSNSYAVWKSMGSPQNPTPEQYDILEKSGKLELLSPGYWTKVDNGSLKFDFTLSRQGISLIKLTW